MEAEAPSSSSRFSFSIEIFDLARNVQSRRLDFPTKNRAAVGGSLENFILARNFQSRSKSLRRLFLTGEVFTRYFFVAFPWLFRGFFVTLICLEKQCLGVFRGFFVAFPWLFRGPRFGQILRVLALEKSSESRILFDLWALEECLSGHLSGSAVEPFASDHGRKSPRPRDFAAAATTGH